MVADRSVFLAPPDPATSARTGGPTDPDPEADPELQAEPEVEVTPTPEPRLEVVPDAGLDPARAHPEPPAGVREPPAGVREPPAGVREPIRQAAPRPEARAAAPQRPAEHFGSDHGATAPQLRRFIKSRAYVPLHELRRRFAINGGDDDVTVLDIDRQRVYVGLPEREGRLLDELVKGGDIGVELSLDPIAPIVVGVYPMRPVPRA